MADDPYADIAVWYDVEHDAYADDLQFYRDLAAGTGPAILEVGCGSGRLTVALARMGRAVTGVDVSAAMLARCRARLAAEPPEVLRGAHLVQGDARALGDAASGPFALAIVPLNTFAHFARLDDRLAVLSELHARLVSGGRLAVDLDLEAVRRLLQAPGQLWLLGSWDLDTARVGVEGADAPVQLVHLASAIPAAEPDAAVVTHLYDALARDGTVRRTISRMTLALLTYSEMESALRQARFAIEAVYGSYELDVYTPGAERAIFIAHSLPAD